MHSERDHRIDFFRGLALVFIFWDHIPHNPFAQVTVRNFGLSDAAEIFVFLAGYAAVLAYGKLYRRDGYLFACVRILRRAWVLYVAHIFLLAILMGIVFLAQEHLHNRNLIAEMGLGYVLEHPQQALVDELLLRFKPNLMDPLPLYIMLLLALPVMLPLLLRWPLASLGLSFGLYLLAPQLNLASRPGGEWFFNPLAWQLLFLLGGFAALRARQPRPQPRPLRRQPLFLAALAYLLASGLLVLSWHWPWLHASLIEPRAAWIYPISKTHLDPLRLLHFLALAYCTAKLLPAGAWLNSWLARQLCRMGRYSLEVFCLSVLLAPLADIGNTLAGEGLPVRAATAIAGVALMALLAAWLDWNKRLQSQPQQPVALGAA